MLPLTSDGSHKRSIELNTLREALVLLLFEHQAQSNLKIQPSAHPHCFFSPVSAFTLSKIENTFPIGYSHTVKGVKFLNLRFTSNESESNPIYTE